MSCRTKGKNLLLETRDTLRDTLERFSKKKGSSHMAKTLGITGRGGGIRTRDPLHPMQVRYQAALRPDEARSITESGGLLKREVVQSRLKVLRAGLAALVLHRKTHSLRPAHHHQGDYARS